MTASLELMHLAVGARAAGLVPGERVPLPSSSSFRIGRADGNDLVLHGVRGFATVIVEPCLGSHSVMSVADVPLSINGRPVGRRHLFEDGDVLGTSDGVAFRYHASADAIPCLRALGPWLLVDPQHSRGRNDVWRAVSRADVGGDIVVINRLPGSDPIGRYRGSISLPGLASMRAETTEAGEQVEVWSDVSGPTLGELLEAGRRQGGVIDDGVLKAILVPVAEATAALAVHDLHTSIRTHQVIVGFDGRAGYVGFDPVSQHTALLFESSMGALASALAPEQAEALGHAVMRPGPALLDALQAWPIAAASAVDVAAVVAALVPLRAAREARLREALAMLDDDAIAAALDRAQ
jgi:hypothetical protein